MKNEILIHIAGLDEKDPRIGDVSRILSGQQEIEGEERLVNFTTLARKLDFDQSWLRRLGVHDRCAILLAGGKRYRSSEVLKYLSSEECKARVEQIRQSRESRGGAV